MKGKKIYNILGDNYFIPAIPIILIKEFERKIIKFMYAKNQLNYSV